MKRESAASRGLTHLELTPCADDAARASAALKEELPGRGKETKSSAEETLARVGSEVDSTVREGSPSPVVPSPCR